MRPLVTVLIASALIAGSADLPTAQERCTDPLNELLARWRELVSAKRADSCSSKARIWLQLRQCIKGYGAWLPSIETVGDCFLEDGNKTKAEEFYKIVVTGMRSQECNNEGTSCAILAAQELRRIDCGFEWLAPDPRRAWTDFVEAVRGAGPEAGSRAHFEPNIRSNRAPFSTSCPADAFTMPSSFSDRGFSVPNGSALERSVVVPIKANDQPWQNFAPGVYKFFRVRVCPYNRPSLQAQRRYFVQIRPVARETEDPPCARSPR
jgi:hypothetical protein